jgi:Tfp pilus assembly protein PilP
MQNNVFSVGTEANGSKITVCGRSIPVAGAITKAALDKAAKDNGIRNYVVKNSANADLFVEDFPYTGEVKIVEYNAAKAATPGVFSVDAGSSSKITVCGRSIPVAGAITKAALDKAAKDNGIRNYVVKNSANADLFVEDFPYTGEVKIVEYNAAKQEGVFSVDAAAPAATGSQIYVCGRAIPVAGVITKAALDKAAKDNGIRNYVVKNNENGQDLVVEDFPFEGSVKIVEYNAAKDSAKNFFSVE